MEAEFGEAAQPEFNRSAREQMILPASLNFIGLTMQYRGYLKNSTV